MNRPVCCCSETCPVHCLVPSQAVEPHPAHGQEGRGPWGGGGGGAGAGGGWGRGCSGLTISRSAPGGYFRRGGNLVQHARSRHTLVTRGEGGDIGVLGWGPRSPPVLHILIHSIFGTRKGTNISVLNSFPSPPLQPPTGSAAAAQSSISGPSTATATPHGAGDAPAGLGLARVLVTRPGAPAGPSPLAEL